MRSDGNPLDNPNQKIYNEKPDIETHDWTRALKWDDKQFKFIKFSKSSSIYCTSDSDKQLDRQKCKNFFLYIENINIETDFDTLITKTYHLPQNVDLVDLSRLLHAYKDRAMSFKKKPESSYLVRTRMMMIDLLDCLLALNLYLIAL